MKLHLSPGIRPTCINQVALLYSWDTIACVPGRQSKTPFLEGDFSTRVLSEKAQALPKGRERRPGLHCISKVFMFPTDLLVPYGLAPVLTLAHLPLPWSCNHAQAALSPHLHRENYSRVWATSRYNAKCGPSVVHLQRSLARVNPAWHLGVSVQISTTHGRDL